MKDSRWFAYLIRCSDRSLYCGATPDLERRVRMHNEGRGARYTRGRGPMSLVWAELFANQSEAMIVEAEIKSLPKARKEAVVGDIADPARKERELLIWAYMSMTKKEPVPLSHAVKLSRSSIAPKICFARFSYAVATDDAIRKIAEVGPVVEMGAGAGYWAFLLRRVGVDVVAYDMFGKGSPHPMSPWNPSDRSYSRVEYGLPERLREHGDRALFLCWPPDHSTMAVDCLDNWDGSNLAYVGDFAECTADTRFYERLRSEFKQVSEVVIPRWMGAKDSLTVWERRRRKVMA